MPQQTPHRQRDLIFQFILLLTLWFALSGQMNLRQWLLGLFSAAAALLMSNWLLKQSKIKPLEPMKGVKWLSFLTLFLGAIFSGAHYYMKRLFDNNEQVIFLSFELRVKHPFARLLIANTMTLSPGTVSVDIEKDVLKLLCFEPRTSEERKQLTQRLDALQDAFKEVDAR